MADHNRYFASAALSGQTTENGLTASTPWICDSWQDFQEKVVDQISTVRRPRLTATLGKPLTR